MLCNDKTLFSKKKKKKKKKAIWCEVFQERSKMEQKGENGYRLLN